MVTLPYKTYIIVASADFDPATEKWIPTVVCWTSDGQRKLHTFNSLLNRFTSRHEAEAFGMETAKAWIDLRP